MARRRDVRLRIAGGCDHADLVEAARRQDEHAVMELIRHCEDRIAGALAAAGLRVGDPLYDDAQNQALLSIWQHFPSYRGEASPCTWMYSIARRVAASRTIDPEVRERRRAERHRASVSRVDLVAAPPEDELVEQDLLHRVLDRLEDEYREILILRMVLELSTSETAELLFLSEGGVKTRLHRAKREALRVAREFEVAGGR